jgi:hypothetical protein
MCQRVTCTKCGKPGFVGCGRHVEQVLGDVPAADRCKCREQAAAGAPRGEQPSVWKRLFG